MDHKLTRQMQIWLHTPPQERSLEEGADLLLRLNSNPWMRGQILRNRDEQKLEYELKKFLKIRLEGLTREEVVLMERRELPRIRSHFEPVPSRAEHTGRREDHDQLPERIRALPERNAVVYKKMKQVYETLKTMENATACDRHEYIKVLVSLDKEYRRNWAAYDNYQPGQDEETTDTTSSGRPADPRAVSAARKYLCANLQDLEKDGGAPKAVSIISKMQERYDYLTESGQTFRPDFLERLKKAGIVTGES